MRAVALSQRSRSRLTLVHDAVVVVALVVIASAWLFAVRFVADDGIQRAAIDAHAYWSVDLSRLYENATVGDLDSFLYSPAAAQAIWPLTFLPWLVFYALWTAILIGCLLFLVGPILGALVLMLPPVWADITTGNIHLLMAVAIVAGFRIQGAWAFVLLTKLTSGIGLLWFALRREWRELAVVAASTGVIVAVSFVLAPHLWVSWTATLIDSGGAAPRAFGLPLWFRLLAGVGIVGFGALKSQRWTVPAGAMVALPVLWDNSFTMLFGCVALMQWAPIQRLRSWPWLRFIAKKPRSTIAHA